MRKVALALAVALAAALPGVSGAVQIDAVREEDAFATWSIPTGRPNHFIWYFAYGWRETHANDESFTVAGVGKGHCVRKRSKRSVSISCSARGGPYKLGDRYFRISPTASSAWIDFTHKGKRYTARWREGEEPQFGLYSMQITCNGGIGGAGGGIVGGPHATARIYGKKLTPRYWWDLSAASSGAYVMECGERLVDRLMAGKTIRLTFTR